VTTWQHHGDTICSSSDGAMGSSDCCSMTGGGATGSAVIGGMMVSMPSCNTRHGDNVMHK